ncbi:glycoside hydrolase family 31 protein [Clostridium aestuarii]|uniref:Glycoside hydrolase family 31 protein n=1 Tax=Clostridium aestuarii TaxID=338193 RepID=A0ABT4D0W2_9CLOT|nr:glycoside hydrolase family 31 protein [Clostridium aestuarii]MCY6484874.1 glycoside hydrolase family 31 protein [Clostridium aestuarii]
MLIHKKSFNAKFENIDFIKNYKGLEKEANLIRIYFEDGKIEVTYFENDIVKIFIGETFEESKGTAAVTKSLDEKEVECSEDEKIIRIIGDKIDTIVNKENLKISFIDKKNNVICQDYRSAGRRDNNIFVSKANDCIAYYGFGEKGGSLNKKGCYLENYNTDNSETSDDAVFFYKTIPFYIGTRENSVYGIYFDNSFRSYFDMGKSNKERMFFGAVDGQLQYYFVPGEDIKEVVKNYTMLTGTMDMPPMWSLGYQQCRYSYYSQQEVEELADTFRKKEIPCDTIYLDIDYMDKYKVMTFNPEKFSNPKKMIEKLDDNGFNIVTIVDPGVKVDADYDVYENGLKGNHYVKKADGEVFEGEVWPGISAFPDFSNVQAREWWKRELKKFISTGIRGLWNDMNEPALFDNDYKTIPDTCIHDSDYGVMEHAQFHNLYGMFMNKCAKEAQEELRENTRSFSMTRATFAGGQRYSSIWTGDNHSKWEDMRMSIEMNCNLGLSGFAFVGNDVGGFIGDCTEELFIRWMELGTFLPIFRNHSADFTRRQEPWSFGTRAEAIAKKAIKLRYRLMPYIYNQYYKAHKEGQPILRPMIMEYPKDINVVDMYSQFMFGDDMLIAPVLYEGNREKLVYLPKGKWYDYFTHKEFEGGRFYSIKVSLEQIAVFVKEGSIIPVYEDNYNYIGEKEQPVTLEIFKGKGKIHFYEDDGISFDYKRDMYNLYEITAVNDDEDSKNEIAIELIHKGLNKKEDFKIKYIK